VPYYAGYPASMIAPDPAPSLSLDLDEFICQMGREPVSSLTHERLMGLVERLHLSDELIKSRTWFARDDYARNLVCRTPEFELLVLCWRPGHESTIHDHAGSLNAIKVRKGSLRSRLFVPAAGKLPGTGPVEMVREDDVAPGTLIGVDRGGVHQLANASAADLVTVHVYAPPLMELVVYSTESSAVKHRTLRYTLAGDLE
jgi:cysteine dioxygenase